MADDHQLHRRYLQIQSTSSHRGHCVRRTRDIGFRGGRINNVAHFGNAVDGEATLCGVLTDELLVGRIIDAIDFVVRDVALDPLDLWAHLDEYITRFLGNGLEFLSGQISCAGEFAFNHVFWHNDFREPLTPPNTGSVWEAGALISLGI